MAIGTPWLPDYLELLPDPIARDKCIAKASFKQGSQILLNTAFSSILLTSEKGQRCDACFRLPSEGSPLKRCSGCGSYWYCNSKCQAFHWRLNHKKICKVYNSHLASPEYQALPEYEKLDSILLSHALAQMSLMDNPYSSDDSSPTSILLSLIPYPRDSMPSPAACPITPAPPAQLSRKLYARFGNNNFAIHSHLTSIGHGIFPMASRLFNHSCVPNAAAKYTLSPAQSVIMEVVALRDILPGEEIWLPYLDPALFQSRGKILQISYGFKCECPSCKFLGCIEPLPEVPTSSSDMSRLARQLRDFVGVNAELGPTLPNKQIDTIPPSLHCVLREDYMSILSEAFSKAAHDGQYRIALDSGLTLLALYVLVYPANYPQIGMHLLELAKTTWNAMISTANAIGDENQNLEGQVRVLLSLARQVLSVYGPEGDDFGPLQEIETLEGLLLNDN